MSHVLPRKLKGMKTSMLIAGILAVGIAAHAGDPTPADVTVYVSGRDGPPAFVEFPARGTVTWMYHRIGVRLAWENDPPASGTISASTVAVRVRFTGKVPDGIGRNALARAVPFAVEGVAVYIMYDRIHCAARESRREAPILAHVLAHEIGHVLQGTDAHAPQGVMKAHWTGQDCDAMERKPLEFTSHDVDLIKDGLNTLKARNAGSSPDVLR